MSKEYYEGMFGSLKHNILLMLSQIEGNIEYSEGADISEDLELIEERCKEIRNKFTKKFKEYIKSLKLDVVRQINNGI